MYATKEFPLDDIRDFIENLPEKEFTSEEKKSITEDSLHCIKKTTILKNSASAIKLIQLMFGIGLKKAMLLPKQRMNDIAMEFLADLIREILMEDEDGIAPLVAVPVKKF